eukprot:4580242-Prymnesium_polylepis.1
MAHARLCCANDRGCPMYFSTTKAYNQKECSTLPRLYWNKKNVTEMLYGVSMGVWSGPSGLI